jgi:hypothetical protein
MSAYAVMLLVGTSRKKLLDSARWLCVPFGHASNGYVEGSQNQQPLTFWGDSLKESEY